MPGFGVFCLLALLLPCPLGSPLFFPLRPPMHFLFDLPLVRLAICRELGSWFSNATGTDGSANIRGTSANGRGSWGGMPRIFSTSSWGSLRPVVSLVTVAWWVKMLSWDGEGVLLVVSSSEPGRLPVSTVGWHAGRWLPTMGEEQ